MTEPARLVEADAYSSLKSHRAIRIDLYSTGFFEGFPPEVPFRAVDPRACNFGSSFRAEWTPSLPPPPAAPSLLGMCDPESSFLR